MPIHKNGINKGAYNARRANAVSFALPLTTELSCRIVDLSCALGFFLQVLRFSSLSDLGHVCKRATSLSVHFSLYLLSSVTLIK